MIFLGNTFLSSGRAFSNTPIYNRKINVFTLRNAIFDTFWVTENTDVSLDQSIDVSSYWGNGTVLLALFQNSLSAGTSPFKLGANSIILLKRRIEGSSQWTTLYQIPVIDEAQDVLLYDNYAGGKTEYEYGIFIYDGMKGNIREGVSETDSDNPNILSVTVDLEDEVPNEYVLQFISPNSKLSGTDTANIYSSVLVNGVNVVLYNKSGALIDMSTYLWEINKRYTFDIVGTNAFIVADPNYVSYIEHPEFKTNVTSDFCGVWIVGKKDSYFTEIEMDRNNIAKVSPSAVVTTLDNQFPYISKNATINYESGSFSGVFAAIDSDNNCSQYKFGVEANKVRKKLNNFLVDNEGKILKYDDGRSWLVNTNVEPIETSNNHPDVILTSFSWTQIGDENSNSDLYYNGLISYLDTLEEVGGE